MKLIKLKTIPMLLLLMKLKFHSLFNDYFVSIAITLKNNIELHDTQTENY